MKRHILKKTYILKIIAFIIVIFASIFILCGYNNSYYMEGKRTAGTFFALSIWQIYASCSIPFVVLSGLSGFIVTGDYAEASLDDFIASLPISRMKRWINTILPGIIFIVGMAGIFIAAAAISYNIHKYTYSEINLFSQYYNEIVAADSLLVGIIPILKMMVTCIAVYGIAAMSRIMSKNTVLSVAIFLGIIITPYYFLGVINNVGIRYFNNVLPYYNEITHALRLSYISTSYSHHSTMGMHVVVFEYNQIQIIAMSILSVMAITIGTAIAVSGRRNGSELFATQPLKIIFQLFAPLYAAFLLPVIKSSGNLKLGVLIGIMIVIYLGVFAAIRKIMNISGKYVFLNAGGKDE